MFEKLLKLLGLAPPKPKTGAREAAVLVFIVAEATTIGAMWAGPGMVSAMVPVLGIMWPATLGFMGYAFKMKNDRVKAETPPPPMPPAMPTMGGEAD